MAEASLIQDFFNRLHSAGLSTDVGTRLLALNIFAELSETMDLRNDRNEIADYLRPIIVQRSEQEIIYDQAVKDWAPKKSERTANHRQRVDPGSDGHKLQDRDRLKRKWRERFAVIPPYLIGVTALALAIIVVRPIDPKIESPSPTCKQGYTRNAPTESCVPIKAEPIPGPIIPKKEDPTKFLAPQQQILEAALTTVMTETYDAPTLRELHAIDMFNKTNITQIAKRSGLPVDQPLLMSNKDRLERILWLASEAYDTEHSPISKYNDAWAGVIETRLKSISESGTSLPFSAQEAITSSKDAENFSQHLYTVDNLTKTLLQLDDPTQSGLSDVAKQRIARLVSADAYENDIIINISDGEWLPLSMRPSPRNTRQVFLRTYASEILAIISLLLGCLMWLNQAMGAKIYLRRNQTRRGTVKEFASAIQTDETLFKESARDTAINMLDRMASHPRFNVPASIKATLKAGGLFKPVEKSTFKIPEYLFLIDSWNPSDHGGRRAVAYMDSLRAEDVKIDHYFFERSPDRVRSEIGKASKPLETIFSAHRDKRLVIIGDPALFMKEGHFEAEDWVSVFKIWPDRTLLTSVPTSEWGREEYLVAKDGGISIAPLSLEGLALTPERIELSEAPLRWRIQSGGALLVDAPPHILRYNKSQLLSDIAPEEDWIDHVKTALFVYLGPKGYRWLCACGVYPLLDWTVTMGLGHALRDSKNAPIATEALTAKISNLPWMRRGYMPDWLRRALIYDIGDSDSASIRKFIADILASLEDKNVNVADAIGLRFKHVDGQTNDNTAPFIEFMTTKTKLDNTETQGILKAFFRPKLSDRLRQADATRWVGVGVLGALLLGWLIPNITPLTMRFNDWVPLIVFIAAILSSHILLAFIRSLSSLSNFLFNSLRRADRTKGLSLMKKTGPTKQEGSIPS